MNPISSWLCTNTTKNLFVKIVHPGGRVELHDRPIQAAELLTRNPKCCVAHTTVFQHPYDIVSPTTSLTLGQKYYVVPISTVRKLQLKYSQNKLHGEKDKEMDSIGTCWLMKSDKNDSKAKNGKKSSKVRIKVKRSKNSNGLDEKKQGKRHKNPPVVNWQPVLEKIIEE